MNGFHGKSYRYKDKVAETAAMRFGVCNTLQDGVFMIGHTTTGGHKRMKALPLFGSIDEAQKALDEFAAARGLSEVKQ